MPSIWFSFRKVVIDDETRIADYDDATLTENTRAAYPIACD